MTRFLSICLAIFDDSLYVGAIDIYFQAVINTGHGVSTKVDFGEEEGSSAVLTNSSKSDDEDVEVKHTIVVSTKLKNNNRRGIHGSNDGDQGTLTYNVGRREITSKDDSGEVPVLNGYKAVETTQIRSPDTRHKTQMYPESVVINRNIRDEYDIYPNLATNPLQWKPSSFFNNINSWSSDFGPTNLSRERSYQNPVKIHRRITDNDMSEFYCRRCRELTNDLGRGCAQQRNAWSRESTTQKMKLDGKLAKLN